LEFQPGLGRRRPEFAGHVVSEAESRHILEDTTMYFFQMSCIEAALYRVSRKLDQAPSSVCRL